MTGEFQRYLEAKRPIDDRSIDRRVFTALTDALAETAAGRDDPLRVLDVGAGVGTMVERLVEWGGLPPGRIEYTAVDIESDNTDRLPGRLESWAADRDFATTVRTDGVELDGPDRTVDVTAHTADAADFVAGTDRTWDLLVGTAFLDIVALDRLSTLLSGLVPGGHWYFPVTFDGGTRFGPDHPADAAVERHYHRHMDQKPGGDSNAGQHTLEYLTELPEATVTAVAGSDWVVRPQGETYPGDEAFFVEFVLGTVETALGELDSREGLDDATLDDWLETRRQQVTDAELVYLTHQLDLLGRVETPPDPD